MGFRFPGARVGLGVSGVDEVPLAGTIYELDEGERDLLLEAPSSDIYERFWEGRAP